MVTWALIFSHLLVLAFGVFAGLKVKRDRWILAGKRDAEQEHGWQANPYLSSPAPRRHVWSRLNHQGDLVTRTITPTREAPRRPH